MRNHLLEKLIEKRFQGSDAIRKVLKTESQQARSNVKNSARHRGRGPHDGARELKGVYRGNYYRLKIPEDKKARNIPRLPPTAPAPNLNALVAEASSLGMKKKTHKLSDQAPSVKKIQKEENSWSRFSEWFTANWGTLLLNFGSLCTLAAFTRSDVLELRTLSATGSICNAAYHAANSSSNWFSVLWPGIFAGVNGWKIIGILEERNAVVHLDEEEERIYVEYFMTHGITPKQFERLENKADILHIKKGDVIIRKGATPINHIYLVVKGATSASILGRHLSAHSTSSRTKGEKKPGGDSGVWIGEMAFLDGLWDKEEHSQTVSKVASKAVGTENQSDYNESIGKLEQRNDKASPKEMAPPKKALPSAAMYTIVAKDDCVVWRWSFESMESLMASSNDMRGALTRAMTTAVVGKVVNMTMSRTKIPLWSSWLGEWSREDGAKIELQRIQTMPEEQEEVSIEVSQAA